MNFRNGLILFVLPDTPVLGQNTYNESEFSSYMLHNQFWQRSLILIYKKSKDINLKT